MLILMTLFICMLSSRLAERLTIVQELRMKSKKEREHTTIEEKLISPQTVTEELASTRPSTLSMLY